MSVISIHEIWKGRDADGSVDDTRYTRVFRIWTNNPADDGAVVGSALATAPWNIYPGRVYPTDSRAFCIGCRPNNDLGACGWIAAATYSTKRELAQEPQNDPIEISWDEEDIEVPVIKDRDGHAVLNSAGDPPDPPVMASDSILVAKIELHVAAVPAYLRAYRKSINSTAFKIDGLTVNAKHGRVRRMSLGKQKFRGSYPFRDVSIELAITDNDEDDWELRFLDAGFRKAVLVSGTTYRMEKITNADKTEPTLPVPLDGNGLPLADPTPETCIYNEVKYYRLKNFVSNIPGCVAP